MVQRFVVATCAFFVLAAGCGGSTVIGGSGGAPAGGAPGSGGSTGGATGEAGSSAGGAGGTSLSLSSGTVTSTGTGGCMDLVTDAVFVRDAVDVIFVVDNSGSMADEVSALEQTIDDHLVQSLNAHGLDHRFIVLSQHGTSSPLMCVPPPLSGNSDCTGPPVNVPGQFYHYSTDVQSHEPLCKILSTLHGVEADDYGLAPGGWIDWLRPDALKAFVMASDDGVDCEDAAMSPLDDNNTDSGGQQVASLFDQKLLLAAPAQFGTQSIRRYVFYSMLGIVPKNFDEPVQHYEPDEPITLGECIASGIDPGTGYQWLSKNTNALRFPGCSTNSYAIFFPSLAADLNDHALNRCRMMLPDPPLGEELDLNTISVVYSPGNNGTPQELTRVHLPEMCGPANFYVDLATSDLKLCDQSCAAVKADAAAGLEVVIHQCFPADP